MKRADYINPEKVATPEEMSMYDHLMDIIRVEVMRVADQFINIPYTDENKERLEAEIRTAIGQALRRFVTPSLDQPPLTRETETEEMRRAMDILRRLREVNEGNPPAAPWIWPTQPVQPYDNYNWPHTTRDYIITTDRTEPFVISEGTTTTGSGGASYSTNISGISVMGYSNSNSDLFGTTYDTGAGVWGPLEKWEKKKNLITKGHVQKIWEKVYGGL